MDMPKEAGLAHFRYFIIPYLSDNEKD